VYSFTDYYIPYSFRQRGFDVPDIPAGNTEEAFYETPPSIPQNYIWARDAIPLWNIFRYYHSRAIDRFYRNDNEVANDRELQAFCTDITTNGELRGFPAKITTTDQLSEMITAFVFTVTGFHATMNNQQFQLQGYIPNQPHWMYGGTPKLSDVIDEKYMVTKFQHTMFHTAMQSSVARLLAVDTIHNIMDYMGKYASEKSETFLPLKSLAEGLPTLQSRLSKLESIITARNANTAGSLPGYQPLVVLKPSKIPVSIEK